MVSSIRSIVGFFSDPICSARKGQRTTLVFIQNLCEKIGKSAASKAQQYAYQESVSTKIPIKSMSLVQKISRFSIEFFLQKPLEKISRAFSSASNSLDLYLFRNEMRGKSRQEIENFLYVGEFYMGQESTFINMYFSKQYQLLDLHLLQKIIIAKELQGETCEKESKGSGIDHLAYMQMYKILLRDLTQQRRNSTSYDNLNKLYVESLSPQNPDSAKTRKTFFIGLKQHATFKTMPKYYQEHVLEVSK